MTDEQVDLMRGARFEKLLRMLDFNGKTFASEIKVSQSLISQIITGKRGISKLILEKLTSRYSDVNIHWLYTGDGEMFLSPGETNDRVEEPKVHYLQPQKIALEDVPNILQTLQQEVKELRSIVESLQKDKL